MKTAIVLILSLSLFCSALMLVWLRHVQRQALQATQQTQTAQQSLAQEWRQLQLEHSAWTQPERIERIAREQLNMRMLSERQQ
jgi:cell division protein FtsL